MVDYIALAASLAAVGGLIFTGISFHRFRKTEDLRLIEAIYRDIRSVMKEINLFVAQSPDPKTDEEKELQHRNLEPMLFHFFGAVNWLCFLILEKKVKDKTLIEAFKHPVVDWYATFEEYATDDIFNDKTAFTKFREFHQKIQDGKI
jgi:hypothetical protein